MKEVLDIIYNKLYDEKGYNKEYSYIYKIHKYWARKPWYIVEKYINDYTNVGDKVLDPFMGSGCTGVEAILEGRDFTGYDLNPISIKIAQGTMTKVNNLDSLFDDFEKLKEACKLKIMDCYNIEEKCPFCNSKMSIKHICIGPKTNNKNLATIYCSNCQNKKAQRKLVLKEINKNYDNLLKEYWYPSNSFPKKFYKDRFSYKNIKKVSDMYTKRNLYTLSLLLDSIKKVNLKNRDLFILAFTNTVLHASKLKGENVRPLSVNNYWVPDDYIEENVWFRFEDRFNNLMNSRIYFNKKNKANNSKLGKFELKLESCLNMNYKCKFDYIFTDPPYGDTIQYSELSYIYNSWINEEYDIKEEVIINPVQNKGPKDFANLLGESIKKMYSALKNEKYLTLCFQNKDYTIWKETIDCCKRCGFILEDINIYDLYGNPYNKYWSKFSPKADIYITFKKTKQVDMSRFFKQDMKLEDVINDIKDYIKNKDKNNNKLYDLTIAYIIWNLYYNEGTLDIKKFNTKIFATLIESK